MLLRNRTGKKIPLPGCWQCTYTYGKLFLLPKSINDVPATPSQWETSLSWEDLLAAPRQVVLPDGRTLRFEEETLPTENYQGIAVMNFTDRETPYTRIIEHKHFTRAEDPKTIITREYPAAWQPGDEPFYPLNDAKNCARFAQYEALMRRERRVRFGGRLGRYCYYDMHQVVRLALDDAAKEC